MPATRTNGWLLDIALLLARVSLAAYFLLAGLGKFRMGHEMWMSRFGQMQPAWLPQWFAGAYGPVLPYLEAGTGVLLMMGLLGRLASGGMAMLLISFTIVTGLLSASAPFHLNGVLLPLAFLLTITGPGRIAVDSLVFGPPGTKRGSAMRPKAGAGSAV